MEMLTNTTKRKKRKTRKCLDEIRKRSRYNTNVSNTNQHDPNSNKLDSDSSYIKSISNCITSDRLTLAMFPKAIRSETITRPLVTQINEKDTCKMNNNNEKSMNAANYEKKESLKIMNNEIEISSDENKSAFEECSELEEISLHNENDDVKSSNSLVLFSSESLTAGTSVLDESPKSGNFPVAPTMDSTSSRSSQEDYRCFYEEFINEIPTHMRRFAPGLFTDEFYKRNQPLQNKDINREYKENISKSVKNPYNSNINPIGYANKWQQTSKKVHDRLYQCNFETPRSPFTAYLSTTSGSSSTTSGSSSTTSSSSSTETGIHDTPEYVYYPHKLN